MIETIRQGLNDDGYTVSISQLCRRFGIPRRTVYDKATKKSPTVQERSPILTGEQTPKQKAPPDDSGGACRFV